MREQMGWNRKELAERARRPQDSKGLHPSHIGLIERTGRVSVHPETLEKLAAAFGITVARLLGEDTEGQPAFDLEPYRQAIDAARANGLDPDQLLQLVNMATIFKK
jgi:transcriptional regulator with XRE-family HTH domain